MSKTEKRGTIGLAARGSWLRGDPGRPAQMEKLRGKGRPGLSIWKLAPGDPGVCGKREADPHPQEGMGSALFTAQCPNPRGFSQALLGHSHSNLFYRHFLQCGGCRN